MKKTAKTILFLLLMLLLAAPRAAFAQGEFVDLAELSGAGSGILSGDSVSAPHESASSGDLVSSVADSIASKGGDLVGDAAGDFAGDMTSDLVGGMLGGGMLGDMAGDYAGDLVSDLVGDAVGDFANDMFGDMLGDLLSIPEIGSIQETLNGLASSMQGALIGPNIPHYRILWMFSGESVVDEVKSLFNGDFSNIEEGLDNLKQMF